MAKVLSLVAVILAFALGGEYAAAKAAEIEAGEGSSIEVHVSPDCAVVLVSAGMIFAGVLAEVITGLFFEFLGFIGFESIGIAKGSAAALRQSTFPLVKRGSVFSKLQSITMTDSGSIVSFVPGSLVGGAAAAAKIGDVCKAIDGLDPKSVAAKKLIETKATLVAWVKEAGRDAKHAWEFMKHEGHIWLDATKDFFHRKADQVEQHDWKLLKSWHVMQ